MRIGDFSKLSRVSIKALRYYDQMGMLKPIDVDRSTGYRSYSVSQLPRLNRILALKDLGLSLEQIASGLLAWLVKGREDGGPCRGADHVQIADITNISGV